MQESAIGGKRWKILISVGYGLLWTRISIVTYIGAVFVVSFIKSTDPIGSLRDCIVCPVFKIFCGIIVVLWRKCYEDWIVCCFG